MIEAASVVNNLTPQGVIPKNVCTTAPTPIRPDGVSQYLLGLSSLCAEVARNPRLLPVFVRLLARAPSTLAALQRAQRRLAA